MSHARTIAISILALPSLAPCGCGGDEPAEPTLEERLDGIADCTPGDLVVLLPWTGPAFDPDTHQLLAPLPAGHVEAVVTGWRDRSDAATKLRLEHGQLVAADVFTRDGLLGFQGVESDECDISLSHTLWKDEASMFAFVAGGPHVTAMSLAAEIHHASAGAHWTADARTRAPTWQEGVARLVTEVRAELARR